MSITTTEVLAAAVVGMVEHGDVTDSLDHLLSDCAELVHAAALGILVQPRPGAPLELLAATSHRVAELELYQQQVDDGPCVETVASGEAVTVRGQEALAARWGTIGPAIVESGYHAVQGFPMRWQGLVLGGLNVFYPTAEVADQATGQLLADIASLVVARAVPMGPAEVEESLRTALAGRIVVEQAKGVLAHQTGTDPDEAYEVLRQRAREAGSTLTRTAETVVRSADRRNTRRGRG
ncbi:GAF and ANTAR domain-containing protein [Auraticoccus monumenti]|uniref:ANTAR domain-containing protein n=1 Tax=Auraticoccus monumenti TaxID=675864 RepID=A0A1G7BVV4_9ACTN|nr:GAF and ANTAR domain-containing protein [Auraticoccus monumenti]SDE31153.1 ANTAR domain-containing protein [Auraticoccus monumenti]